MHHSLTGAMLVAIAVGLAVVCAVGLAIVQDSLERLHFSAVVVSFSVGLITIAIWITDPVWQSRIKATIVAVILFLMNSILSHSTARAIRIFENGQFLPRPGEQIPLIGNEKSTGGQS
jgi:multisubunit Na+/H+ antiporter MnhG subunit